MNVASNSPSPGTFQRLLGLTYKNKKQSNKEVQDAVEIASKKLIKQYEELLSIKNEEDRSAAKIRLEIVEDILTLKCPKCRAAFYDFTGCAALTCGRCGCGFCAYCLANCGADAHAHVAHCPDGGGGGYQVFVNGGWRLLEYIYLKIY